MVALKFVVVLFALAANSALAKPWGLDINPVASLTNAVKGAVDAAGDKVKEAAAATGVDKIAAAAENALPSMPSLGDITNKIPGANFIPSLDSITNKIPGMDSVPSLGDITDKIPGVNSIPSLGDITNKIPGASYIPSVSDITSKIPGASYIPSVSDITSKIPGSSYIPSLGDITSKIPGSSYIPSLGDITSKIPSIGSIASKIPGMDSIISKIPDWVPSLPSLPSLNSFKEMASPWNIMMKFLRYQFPSVMKTLDSAKGKLDWVTGKTSALFQAAVNTGTFPMRKTAECMFAIVGSALGKRLNPLYFVIAPLNKAVSKDDINSITATKLVIHAIHEGVYSMKFDDASGPLTFVLEKALEGKSITKEQSEKLMEYAKKAGEEAAKDEANKEAKVDVNVNVDVNSKK